MHWVGYVSGPKARWCSAGGMFGVPMLPWSDCSVMVRRSSYLSCTGLVARAEEVRIGQSSVVKV